MLDKSNKTESMKSAIKIRLYPNKTQLSLMKQSWGADRFIYNRALALKKKRWDEHGENLSWLEISKMVTFWKQTDEFSWMKIPPRSIFEQSLKKMDIAYQNFFAGRAKFPRFKSKLAKQSFVLAGPNSIVDGNRIKLPKLGIVRAKGLRNFSGDIKNVTISRNKSGQIHATFVIEKKIKTKQNKENPKVVGIDVNLENFLTDSKGNRVENPRFKRHHFEKIKHYQRRKAHCQKGSKRASRWRQKVAREFQKVANKKSNFLHKLSHEYVKSHDVIKVEDLQIKNMVRNHKLAESISSVAWGEFFRQLEYKCEWEGKTFEKVDPKNTSRDCSGCGVRKESLSLSERLWTCEGCGLTHIRDVNAAVNIKNKKGRGTVLKAIGATDIGRGDEFGKTLYQIAYTVKTWAVPLTGREKRRLNV